MANPLISRIQSDGILNPAAGSGMGPSLGQQNALNNAGLYAPGSFGAQNAIANGTGAAWRPNVNWGQVGQLGSPQQPQQQPQQNIMQAGMPVSPAMPVVWDSNNPSNQVNPSTVDQRARTPGGWPAMGFSQPAGLMAPGATVDTVGFGGTQIRQGGPDGTSLTQNPNTVPGAAGYVPPPPQDGLRPGSPNAGMFAAFPKGTIIGDYVRGQEAHNLPVDIEHLKILSTVQKNQDSIQAKTAGAAGEAAGVTAAATAPKTGDPVADANAARDAYIAAGKPTLKGLQQMDKAVESATTAAGKKMGHDATLAQINEQNDAVLSNINDALAAAPAAGPVAGRMIGQPGFKDVTRLHGLLESISGNEMMDYIQRLKNASPQGTIGFRVLETEAKAMSNVFAAIKDDKVPLERQDPEFVARQLGNLKYHLVRMNAIANGKDPDSVMPSATPNAGAPTSNPADSILAKYGIK